MKREKYLITIFILLSGSTLLLSQTAPADRDSLFADSSADTLKSDTLTNKKTKIKTGGSWGAVPAVAYDSDIGFQYGAVLELWDYGDGKEYPNYNHYLYFEYSNTTKGSQIIEFDLDSRVLIPKVRTLLEASYLTERALDFYGFNGYESYYNALYEDDSWENRDNYFSRLYFRQERKLLRLRSDFQGRFFSDKAKWLAGITYYNISLDTVNISRLNEGKVDSLKLPGIGGGLYGQYAYEWNIIPEDQVNGGMSTIFKAGLMYDTRDNEANPMRGIWTEGILFAAPGFLSDGYGFGKISLIHRQYFTIIPNRLSFVYRIAYQGKLWGELPSYMLPLLLNGGTAKDRDGLGGSKTVRGMMRNRVVGEDYLYGNLELRWKFLQTILFKQNVYLAVNTFVDFGMVTGKYDVEDKLISVPAEYQYLFPLDENEVPHICYGAGFHIAINENFIIAINNGFVTDKRDGTSGLYIGLKWLF